MTRDWAGKRYWIVGASEGLGREVARRMSAMGCELVLSARSEDRLRALAAELPGRAEALAVDVADGASVAAAAAAAGRIDGVVFLAGVYWPVGAARWDAGRVEAMMDVNATGAARVVGAVIGDMVARGEGHVVLTGSLSGFRGLPGAIGYAASKAAVMVLAESMHADLRGTGVQVQVANPGFVRTRLTEKNDFSMPFLLEPEDAARRMVQFMGTERFKASFPGAFAALFRAGQFFPDWLWYRVFGR